MLLYLGKQSNNLYMLSALKPIISRIRGSEIDDLYFRSGEPIGVRNLCIPGIVSLFGDWILDMKPCEFRRINLYSKPHINGARKIDSTNTTDELESPPQHTGC